MKKIIAHRSLDVSDVQVEVVVENFNAGYINKVLNDFNRALGRTPSTYSKSKIEGVPHITIYYDELNDSEVRQLETRVRKLPYETEVYVDELNI